MIKGILKRPTRPAAPRRPIDALIAAGRSASATGIARSQRPHMSGCRRSCSGATMTEMDTIPDDAFRAGRSSPATKPFASLSKPRDTRGGMA